MQKVMTFIKANLLPLICGLVVLVALVAWLVWPLPSWKADLQTQMQERYQKANDAKGLITNITIPGGVTLTNATYENNVIKAAEASVNQMKAQAAEINSRAASQNSAGRLAKNSTPAKPVPLLEGQPQEDYLPVIDHNVAQPQRFKTMYTRVFPRWNALLIGKENVAGTPPVQTDVRAAYEAEQRAKVVPGNPMFSQGGVAPGVVDPNEVLHYEKMAVYRRASEIKTYVDNGALAPRPWANASTPPNETQIFNALVDCWLIHDVVQAIVETNKQSHNVTESPVKRLEKLDVGVGLGANGAPADSNNAIRFFIGAQAGTPGAVPATPAIDLTRDLTGRASNGQYDVVLMNLVVDVDPAYQNQFLDALYRQNNGYTVLNIRTTTIDPFDAASNGYLYGQTQCVHLEIQIEALLYRSWTQPLMPDSIRVALGLPALPPPGAPAPAAPAAPAAAPQ